MEKIFLDTNAFMDIIEKRRAVNSDFLEGNALFISVNTIGIWSYIYKISAKDIDLPDIKANFNLVEYSKEIVEKSCLGPTEDYEDNLQLHSAVTCGANIFITRDKSLLNLGYFGKMRLISGN